MSSREKRGTWLTPYWDAYCARFPGVIPNGGFMGKCIKPYHDRDGEAQCLAQWVAYLNLTDAMFVSPARFAAGYGAWVTAYSGKQSGNSSFSAEPLVQDGWLGDELERRTRP